MSLKTAEVTKGDTEWKCQSCGAVTTISGEGMERRFNGGNVATKRCEGCGGIMQGQVSVKDREAYREWKEEQEKETEADALSW